ncbi:hypothetical protein P9112_010671 [Eukaryota sp. TZLM1-RC]
MIITWKRNFWKKNALFSSGLAAVTDETVNQLVNLYPAEALKFEKPYASQFGKQNPLSVKAVEAAILRLPSRKAPGPSGITFDMLKSVGRQNSFNIKELCSLLQHSFILKILTPKKSSTFRLVALTKPNGSVEVFFVLNNVVLILANSAVINTSSIKKDVLMGCILF